MIASDGEAPLPWLSGFLLRESHKLAAVAHEDIRTVQDVVDKALERLDTAQDDQEEVLAIRLREGRKATKLTLLGPALLQRLILKTSDEVAHKSEQCAVSRPSAELMIARYLQCLVFLGVSRSSRWVACGIGQLVYAYPGSAITKMVKRLRNEDYDERKRKRDKSKLMSLLGRRFSALRTVAGDGGEKHFEPHADQERCYGVVVRVLTVLAPWDPARSSALPDMRKRLAADWDELARCRGLGHPDLFEALITELRLPPPRSMLRFPRVLP